MSEDRKKYNTRARYCAWNIRLTKDAVQVSDTFVRLSIADDSAAESDSTMWVEIIPTDNQVEMSKFLKKNDTIPYVEGKLTLRYYGEKTTKHPKGEQFGLNLRGARMELGWDLIEKLKERGYKPVPQGDRPQRNTPRPPANVKTTRQVQNPVDFGDDE